MQNLKQQALATLDKIIFPSLISGLNTFPELQTSMILIYGFFGVTLQYKQNEVNELIEFIINNPGVFTSEVVKTEEFQDGFIIIFESYIKERNKDKRKIIKNILLGFTEIPKEEKEKYELEKILHILKICTDEEISFLSFLKKNIEPLFNQYVKEELKRFEELRKEGNFTGSEGNDIPHITGHNPLTNFITKYLKEKYKDDIEFNRKHTYYHQLKKQVSNLGIFSYHTQYSGGGIGSGGTKTRDEYNFNKIGKQFISYILNYES